MRCQILSKSSECDIVEQNVTEREENNTLIDNFTSCQSCQTSLTSSECVYIEHELVENAEQPDFCSIIIVKEDTLRENGEANHKYEDKEGEHKVDRTLDSLSTEADFGDSDGDTTDVDIGDVDLDDILEAEGMEDKNGRQILREFEHENLFGDEVVGSLVSPPTSATPNFPPGLKIYRDPPHSSAWTGILKKPKLRKLTALKCACKKWT